MRKILILTAISFIICSCYSEKSDENLDDFDAVADSIMINLNKINELFDDAPITFNDSGVTFNNISIEGPGIKYITTDSNEIKRTSINLILGGKFMVKSLSISDYNINGFLFYHYYEKAQYNFFGVTLDLTQNDVIEFDANRVYLNGKEKGTCFKKRKNHEKGH